MIVNMNQAPVNQVSTIINLCCSQLVFFIICISVTIVIRVCDKQCEESWEYVEFLKEEISTPVTDILTNFKTTLDGEKAVESTMQGVGIKKQKKKQLNN